MHLRGSGVWQLGDVERTGSGKAEVDRLEERKGKRGQWVRLVIKTGQISENEQKTCAMSKHKTMRDYN